MSLPQIIQGGMGAGVSDWRLARSVSARGQIGVVSGTALDVILTRRLQLGDPGGHIRRALSAFPDQTLIQPILDRYFIEGGKATTQPFAGKQMIGHKIAPKLEALIVVANFVEVFLAKENHDGLVGINYLHKIQSPTLPSLYGAILAEVDIILVGAGIPVDIPEFIDRLTRSESVSMKVHVRNAAKGTSHLSTFDPGKILSPPDQPLKRPLFFPIVSSVTLAAVCVKKCPGQIDGFIIEGPTAGGHNAPPRGKLELSAKGEPVYGKRDEVDLGGIKKLGLPFWLAGSRGSPEQLADALAQGASGVQIGTLFAFCDESGMREDLKRSMVRQFRDGTSSVFTDPVGSPTGFPFKVLSLVDTLSEPDVYGQRTRICDLGYLREAFEKPDGTLGWRCPAEDVDAFMRSGGIKEDTIGRKCLCNSLMANIGLQQVRKDNSVEIPLITCGDDLSGIFNVLASDQQTYASSDVIDYMLSEIPVSDSAAALRPVPSEPDPEAGPISTG